MYVFEGFFNEVVIVCYCLIFTSNIFLIFLHSCSTLEITIDVNVFQSKHFIVSVWVALFYFK